jgi:hypothetical protein
MKRKTAAKSKLKLVRDCIRDLTPADLKNSVGGCLGSLGGCAVKSDRERPADGVD